MSNIRSRAGTNFLCRLTPSTERIWNRLCRASVRGNSRQAKKQFRKLLSSSGDSNGR